MPIVHSPSERAPFALLARWPVLWMRRVRGLFGLSAGWLVASASFGAVFGTTLFGGRMFEDAANAAATYGGFALLTGVMFAVLLGLTKGDRSFDEMSYLRFAVLGAVPSLLVNLTFLTGTGFSFPALYSTAWGLGLGMSLACGSLALARRATDPELPDVVGDTPAPLPAPATPTS